ncbi:MAG TPA: histidine phosphatase family protein, partial [Symbiobacteriaceae bacterium]|nr:histidine phosphatase family protein [Symbiobacteriaceae bacterium]
MSRIYVVRHCKAAGQEPEAPLTPEGEQQARRLADFLAGQPIDYLVSSPFRRAQATVAPLAERLGLPVHLDDRLGERVLAAGPLPDWQERLRASFA